MEIKIGHEIVYQCSKPTPMILASHVHYSRAFNLVTPNQLVTTPEIPISFYHDIYGNMFSRLIAPSGQIRIFSDAIINDTGAPDIVSKTAIQHPIESLPDNVLLYLLGSRYCETDLLNDIAWDLFGETNTGWECVKSICDFVHNHIQFDYSKASSSKTAWSVYNDKVGVCRDYAHLAISFCRCMNIPAKYCMGYLSDIGAPPPYGVMDFAAWIEVYLGNSWYIFDPRNNRPCIGRIPLAKGRDAMDVPISSSFGESEIKSFKVWTDEVGFFNE